MKYLTKAELYRRVDKLMEELDITTSDYPIDSVSLAKKYFLDAQIVYENFDNFCALLYRGKKTTTLALNSSRTPLMHNFDCMHEIIHYFLHEEENTFQCTGNETTFCVSDFLEWQANEGAAEALMPYKIFIPLYILMSKENENGASENLAEYFGVTERVVQNRIDNLNYEIYQYKVLNKSIDDIEILSKASCEKQNLTSLTANSLYCTKCHSKTPISANFCPVCGNNLSSKNSTKSGVGDISHSSIEVLDDYRVSVCPFCGNENISRTGFYCHICGKPTVNRCTNQSTKDSNGIALEWPCDEFLSGDARFCPTCGSETLFSKEGYLTKIK